MIKNLIKNIIYIVLIVVLNQIAMANMAYVTNSVDKAVMLIIGIYSLIIAFHLMKKIFHYLDNIDNDDNN